MKQKLSISIDERKVREIQKQLSHGKYRSTSHFIEYAVHQLLDNELLDNKKDSRDTAEESA